MFKSVRSAVILLGLVGIIFFINSQIKAMTVISDEGETVLFELRPVDPRAFMMGDYMTLGYAQEALPPRDGEGPPSGQAVIYLDENKVGTFLRLDDGKISPSETRINYARRFHGQPTYGGPRYYFQEGTAQIYEAAEYGVFKVAPSGRALLVGLADENYKLIKPSPNP